MDWQCAVCANIGPSREMYYCEKCKYGAPAFCPRCVTVIMEEAEKEGWDYKLPLYRPDDPKEDAKERAIAFKLKVESKMKEPRFKQKRELNRKTRERNREKLEKAEANKRRKTQTKTCDEVAIAKIKMCIDGFMTARAALRKQEQDREQNRNKLMEEYDDEALKKYGRSYFPHSDFSYLSTIDILK